MEIELVSQIIVALWYTGMGFSITCLFIQVFLYIVLPSSRKLDQKILTQLTIARLLSIVFEYGSIYESDNKMQTSVVILLYFHSDATVVCWMSVFTKRLYQKLVTVFAEETNFTCVSITVWLGTLPIGVTSGALVYVNSNYIYKFCSVYCTVKCMILTFNLLIFIRIIRVVVTVEIDRNLKSTLKTCINSFLLLSVTSLQVLIRFFYTDQMPFFVPTHDDYRNSLLIIFAIMSCYQVLAITLIFIMILNAANRSDHSIVEIIVFRLKSITY